MNDDEIFDLVRKNYREVNEDYIKEQIKIALKQPAMTKLEIELLKEIRKQTQAPYSDIAKGIRIYKLDKTAIINYLREIAIVYA